MNDIFSSCCPKLTDLVLKFELLKKVNIKNHYFNSHLFILSSKLDTSLLFNTPILIELGDKLD